MSHTALTYHIVFGTYRRQPAINFEHERELYKFVYDFATARGVYVRRINGMPDHIHILCDIPAKFAIADFVKLIKAESSKFMRVNPHFPLWYKWAEGYGAFTVDLDSRTTKLQYVLNQKSHHKVRSFADEYREILIMNGFDLSTPLLGDEE